MPRIKIRMPDSQGVIVFSILPIDSPLALLLAVAIGGLGFHHAGATQNNGSRRPFMWWDYILLGVPFVLALFDNLPSILGMGMILGIILRLGINTIHRGTLPNRYWLGILTIIAAIALPVYAFYARYCRLGIPQRERRVQALLGKINEAQNLHQQVDQPYSNIAALEQEGVLEAGATKWGTEGYRFDLTIAPDGMEFHVTATPLHYGNREVPILALPYLSHLLPRPTGTRTFWMDQTGNVRGDDVEGATPKTAEEVRDWPWVKRF